MIAQIRLSLLVIVVSLALSSCSNKGDEVELTPLYTVIMPDTSFFPNKVGYWWKYRMVRDGDTSLVTVRITGDTTLVGETYNTWEYYTVGGDGEESFWFTKAVSTGEDTIRMTNLLTGTTQVLILPFVTGAAWVNPHDGTDSTFVLGMETVYNDSAWYDDAYHLARSRQAWVYSFDYDYWFKPQVGMVRIHEISSWTGPVGSSDATWDLIARHLWPVSIGIE